MNDRRKLLEFFEQQKETTDKRVAEGIEKHRKGDAVLKVTDKDDNPIKDVTVKAVQKSHEFRFGANLFMLDELETEEKNETYKRLFADTFNMATVPFYWDTLEPERGKPRYAKGSPKVYRRPAPDLCIEFCEQHGIEPREHALAYEFFFPKWLYGAAADETKAALEKRYAEIAERYADKIPTIEVTNEMSWKKSRTEFYNQPDYVDWCFKTAEKYFPDNKLCINDGTGQAWEDGGRVTDKYYAYTEAAMLKGARIDAIGMQFHMHFLRDEEYARTRLILNPENLYRHMDLYARLGKPLQVTEVTVSALSYAQEDEQVQAEILEQLYSIWFSHPSVEQIIYWNLVDGYAHLWDPSPEKIKASQGDMTQGENAFYGGLLRFDMTPKPAFYKLKELIEKRWHTETEVNTDANGTCSFRGFYGQYELTLDVNGETVTKTIDLSKTTANDFTIVV